MNQIFIQIYVTFGILRFLANAGLEVITGSKDQVIKVADFNAIGKAANSLLAKVCKAIPTKPGTNSKNFPLITPVTSLPLPPLFLTTPPSIFESTVAP